jgi:hypothetical protein
MKNYKFKFIFRVSISLFTICLIYLVGTYFYDRYIITQSQDALDSMVMNEIKIVKKNIRHNNSELDKLHKAKRKVASYIIDMKKVDKTINKLKKIVDTTGKFITIKKSKVVKTKYINRLIINLTFTYDMEFLDADIAKSLMKTYARVVIKPKYKVVNIKFPKSISKKKSVDDVLRCSIKVQKWSN